MHKHLLEFCRLTGELLESGPVRMMGRWQHHGRITTLDHSLFVAYLSFRAARWLRLDERAAARGGLLLRQFAAAGAQQQCKTHGEKQRQHPPSHGSCSPFSSAYRQESITFPFL